MVDEELQTVALRDSFYRDSFGKIMAVMISIIAAILLLIGFSIYLYFDKPKPVTFSVDNEWRVVPPVPLTQPYLSTSELLQWVSDAMLKSFVYDFLNYQDQLKEAQVSFTTDGWKAFLNQLNQYANYKNVQDNKLYVSAKPSASPTVLKEGLISESGRYGWWIKFPLSINYNGVNPPANQTVTFQILVVRLSTLNNLMGVGIENIVPSQATGS